MSAILEGRGIVKVFRNGEESATVLRGVDVALQPGELVALLGPSGSGKSTLLSILGLLLQPTSGEVRISGERVDTLGERRRSLVRNERLGFVFQFHHLLPEFTAMENVAFPAAAPAGGISRRIRERASELLVRVGLENRINYPASRLSGGQKQRVAIARALMNRPDVVIADEPTGNLDRATSDQVLDLMAEMNAKEGGTFLICTHDEHVASRCSRRIRMEDGRLAPAPDA